MQWHGLEADLQVVAAENQEATEENAEVQAPMPVC